MKFNINNYASVTLTEYGAKIYNSRYDGLKAVMPNYEFQDTDVKAGHIVRAQLWTLFQDFGPFMNLGSDCPFEGCAMTFDGKDFPSHEELKLRLERAEGLLKESVQQIDWLKDSKNYRDDFLAEVHEFLEQRP